MYTTAPLVKYMYVHIHVHVASEITGPNQHLTMKRVDTKRMDDLQCIATIMGGHTTKKADS